MTRTTTAAAMLAATATVFLAAFAPLGPTPVSVVDDGDGRRGGDPATTSDRGGTDQRDEGGLAGAGIQPLAAVRVAVSTAQNPLVRPVWMGHAPGDPTRLFIIEKRGVIRVLKLDTSPPTLLTTPFLDIDAITTGGTSQASEQGLLGLAFHPNYQQNGMFFVYYTASSPLGANTLSRYQVSGNPDVANTTGTILLSIPDSEGNHNGGWIGFKPGDTQGYLYLAIGDGGGGCDNHGTIGNGQNLTTIGGGNVHALFGKILRIDIDGADNIPGNDDDDGVLGNGSTNGYTSPSTNPFFGPSPELDEIFHYGLRNPWRASFDRLTGDMYIADVGQFAWEEINFAPSASPGPINYGWRCMEGNGCSSVSGCSTTGCACVQNCSGGSPLACPIYAYPNDAAACAVTGGYVYRGARINELRGNYFFADYNCSAAASPIWSFAYSGGSVTNFQSRSAELTPPGLTVRTLTSFGEDYYGEMYFCDQEDGEVFKIVPRCMPDIVFNNAVDVDDLIAVILGWGPCAPPPAACPTDIIQNGATDVDDLIAVILGWGPCP